MSENEAIVGLCPFMCPEAEIREREKAFLIHVFEKSEDHPVQYEDNRTPINRHYNRGTRGGGQNQQRQRRIREVVKADHTKAVKAYTRPAAGVNKTIPTDLRPALVLKKTVAYLCTKILVRTDQPFIEVYDFVFDRLRAVRQDMVIQRISDKSAILILEAIVKFHLYSEYKFRNNAPKSYDPCINQKHLRDCLKTLLTFYGQNEYNGNGTTRPFFEALYCLSSPQSYEIISRAFEIRNGMKDELVFTDALEICLAIQHRNFYKFFQLLDGLPPLLSAYLQQEVSYMRTYALKAISFSYGVQNCKIPLEWIEEVLCYPNAFVAEKELRRIGCQIVQNEEDKNEKFVKFVKSTPFLNQDNDGIVIGSEVKFTVLAGLNNTELIATEQICPWGRELLL